MGELHAGGTRGVLLLVAALGVGLALALLRARDDAPDSDRADPAPTAVAPVGELVPADVAEGARGADAEPMPKADHEAQAAWGLENPTPAEDE